MKQSTKSTAKKEAMLKALEKNLGIVTKSCRIVGIDRTTHYLWMREDETYRAAVDEINDVALDFAESMLHTRMQAGDTTATIFFLKTKGKKRGYVERQEMEFTSEPVKVIISNDI